MTDPSPVLSSRRRPATVVVVAALAGLLLLLAAREVVPRIKAAHDSAMYFVPGEADVLRAFPEVRLAGQRFEGLWGERDRGTWIFRYEPVDGPAALKTLQQQLAGAGWRVVGQDAATREPILRHDARGLHLLMREHPAEVQVMIIVGRRGKGGEDLTKDDFAQRAINTRWRTLKPKQ
jgi:hypothetical protein